MPWNVQIWVKTCFFFFIQSIIGLHFKHLIVYYVPDVGNIKIITTSKSWVLLKLLATSENNSQIAERLLLSGQGVVQLALKLLSSVPHKDYFLGLSGFYGIHWCLCIKDLVYIHFTHISRTVWTSRSLLFSRSHIGLNCEKFLNGNAMANGKI